MSYFTTPQAGTQEIFDNDLFIKQVANANDWSRLYQNSTFAATLLNMGQMEAYDSTEIIINTVTDATHKFSIADGQSVAIPNINSISTSFIDLDTLSGVSGVNGKFRVGEGFICHGESNGTGAAWTDADRLTAILRVEEVNAAGWIKWKTLDITVDGSSTKTGTTVDYGASTPHTVFLACNIDEYDGDAPDVVYLRPENTTNAMQMFRVPFGQGMVADSVPKVYDGSMGYNSLIWLDQLYMKMNRALLFNTIGRPAAATSYQENNSGLADGGTGADYGITKGLAGFLGVNDLSAVDVIGQVDTGTGVDFWNMRSWADQFSTGGTYKYAFTSAKMSTLIAKAAVEVGQDWQPFSIQFPRFTLSGMEYDMGTFRMRVIVDRNFGWAGPSVSDGTNTAKHEKYLFLIDPEYAKAYFHKNKTMGVMAPRIYDVGTTNGSHLMKKEAKAMMGFALWRESAHGVYGITGS